MILGRCGFLESDLSISLYEYGGISFMLTSNGSGIWSKNVKEKTLGTNSTQIQGDNKYNVG